MGKSYTPVGGIGIHITKEMFEAFGYTGKDWIEEDYFLDMFTPEALPGKYYEYGCRGYTNNPSDGGFVLLVEGDTFTEVQRNVDTFLEKLAVFDIHLTEDDLMVISEKYVG